MRDQARKYMRRLEADRAALPGRIAVLAQDDVIIREGDERLARLGGDVLSRLSSLGLIAAVPSLPFADFLVRRAPPGEDCIVPRDTETRTFLHDIPFLRAGESGDGVAARVARLLGRRKAVLVEGLGIVSVGPMTVEHAYINYSSAFHAVFVKYLLDVLQAGFRLPGEEEAFAAFRGGWLRPLSADGIAFRRGPLETPDEVFDEIAEVGRRTVERGLVDSFFGNISCRVGGVVYISQTAASLDELSGCIDPVPADNSTTAGITASSELLAHRAIYDATGARTILHGHPKFAVAMSMLCEEAGCAVTDCWRDCDRVRLMGDTPVVAGEIGAGGLAKRVAPVIGAKREAVVYGHGVFAIGAAGFEEPFRAVVDVENRSRSEYFRRLGEKR